MTSFFTYDCRLSLDNISTASLPQLVAERNNLLAEGHHSIAQVVEAVAEERLEARQARNKEYEAIKHKYSVEGNFEMFVQVRRDAEHWHKQTENYKRLLGVYHLYEPLKLQLYVMED